MTAVLALLVVLVFLGGRPPRTSVPRTQTPETVPLADLGVLQRLRAPLVVLCVLGVWLFLGGMPGLLGGLVAAAFAWRALGAGEGPAARRRRQELEEGLPFAVHLLGACLRSGAAINGSLDAVAVATGGAVGAEFQRLQARLALGSDPGEVWGELAAAGPLAPLGRALLRAHRSGSSVSTAIDRLAEDLVEATHAAARAKARTVEVRASAPLGLCLLPAFLLLGVVPLTVGLFRSLDVLG